MKSLTTILNDIMSSTYEGSETNWAVKNCVYEGTIEHFDVEEGDNPFAKAKGEERGLFLKVVIIMKDGKPVTFRFMLRNQKELQKVEIQKKVLARVSILANEARVCAGEKRLKLPATELVKTCIGLHVKAAEISVDGFESTKLTFNKKLIKEALGK